ncbi:hypothetical protein F5Y14DRAFT_428226 [Nemania sp. NC0429]|nr:hypothetical protein F5Y14DRAFT_428226 [Nemania sp. NC0429]
MPLMMKTKSIFKRFSHGISHNTSQTEAVDDAPTDSIPPAEQSPSEAYGLFEFPQRFENCKSEGASLGSNARSVDIIAVHGLGGGWEKTWSAGPSGAVWLRDRLPEVLASIDVHPRVRSFGYNAEYLFSTGKVDINDCARSLLNRTLMLRANDDLRPRPIIFIAHSMGGLVVQEAINIAHTDHEYYDDVLKHTRGCVFLASPLHGSDAAAWADIGTRIVRAFTFGIVGNSAHPSALRRNSQVWLRISRDFVQRGKNLMFRSFYETEKMAGNIIVKEASVRLNWPNEKVFPLLASNHRTICKFGPGEDQRFGPVGFAVREVVQEALKDEKEYPAVDKADISILSDLPPATLTFFGRNTELERLSTALDPGIAGMKGVVLFGLGGSGKTQLTLRYIQQAMNQYKAIFWIDAPSKELVLYSFSNAAAIVEKSWPSKDTPNPYSGNDVRAKILSRLRSTLYRNWLLVIDNADGLENINYQELIPHNCNHGSIIVTSTKREITDILLPYRFSTIEIDGLDPESSTALLLQKSQSAIESNPAETELLAHRYASKIAKELGYLPLALEHGGILLRKKILKFDTFVSHYHKQYHTLMRSLPKNGDVLHQTRSMHAIFTILYSNLLETSPTAGRLLRLVAILGASPIPVSLVLHIVRYRSPELVLGNRMLDIDEVACRNSLSLLQDDCLIKMKPGADEHPESIQLHRSICQWVTDVLKSDQEIWILFAASAIGDFFCSQKQSLDWPVSKVADKGHILRTCIPAIDRIASRIQEFKPPKELLLPGEELSATYSMVAHNFGFIYFCHARYNDARTLLSEAATYNAAFHLDCRTSAADRVPVLYSLSRTCYKLGALDEALEHLEAAKPHANDSSQTISLDHFLAQVTDKMHIYEQHHNTAVAATQGPKRNKDNEQTFESLYERPKEQMETLNDLAEIQREMLSKDEPDPLAHERVLAWAHYDDNRTNEAIEIFEHILSVRQEMLLKNDVSLQLQAEFELALAYSKNGRTREAHELYQHVVAAARKTWNGTDQSQLSPEIILSKGYILSLIYGDLVGFYSPYTYRPKWALNIVLEDLPKAEDMEWVYF